MEIEFILYVKNQQRSCDFYTTLLACKPSLHVPGMTEFTLSENCKLGLMPADGIAKIITPKTPHPSSADGIPRCELYLKVENIKLFYERTTKMDAMLVSKIAPRDWGDTVAYFSDPDGHIIAIAEKTN